MLWAAVLDLTEQVGGEIKGYVVGNLRNPFRVRAQARRFRHDAEKISVAFKVVEASHHAQRLRKHFLHIQFKKKLH